jgi:hypothetical protein
MMEEKSTYITIVGFGSLLSLESAKRTFPNLKNYRKAKIQNYKRTFNIVGIFDLRRGFGNPKTGEIASLAAIPCKGAPEMLVIVFEIEAENLLNFHEREHRYEIELVKGIDEFSVEFQGLICCESTDEKYKQKCLKESIDSYENRVGQYWKNRVWYNSQEDIPEDELKYLLPIRPYLEICLKCCKAMGDDYYDNFVKNTTLADRKTTIEEYILKANLNIE